MFKLCWKKCSYFSAHFTPVIIGLSFLFNIGSRMASPLPSHVIMSPHARLSLMNHRICNINLSWNLFIKTSISLDNGLKGYLLSSEVFLQNVFVKKTLQAPTEVPEY